MASTYTSIATTTGTGISNTITFSSIPSTYTDLILICNSQLTLNAGTGWLRFNGDSGTNYSDTYLYGDGTSATSGRHSSIAQSYCSDATASGFVTSIHHIQNYANTTTYKTFLSRSNYAPGGVAAYVGLWRSTSAINSITFSNTASPGYYTTSSTFTLYGVTAA
jgi:hypothetical protein